MWETCLVNSRTFTNLLDHCNSVFQTSNLRHSTLGQEDPLEKEMATHCSILAWEIPWTEEPRAPQLEETPETPPSSRAEGLLFLHGLETTICNRRQGRSIPLD